MTQSFPKNWRDCKPFVDALLRRKYLGSDAMQAGSTLLSEGFYLYMYELWQDGHESR